MLHILIEYNLHWNSRLQQYYSNKPLIKMTNYAMLMLHHKNITTKIIHITGVKCLKLSIYFCICF